MEQSNNLYTLLLHAYERNPEGALFYFDNSPMTGKEAVSQTGKTASYFKSRGIKKGDRILLHLGNTPEFLYTYFAASQLGAVVILVNPQARRFELKYYIHETEPKIVVTSERSLPGFKFEDGWIFPQKSIMVIDSDETGVHFHKVIADQKEHTTYEMLDEKHPTAVIFTSAMDGFALGAVMTHSSILHSVMAEEFTNEPTDTFLSVLPLFHAFGLTSSFFIPLYYGGSIKLMSRFVPDDFIKTLTSGEVNVFNGVPVMYKLINGMVPKGTTFPAMKYWVSGGERIAPELINEMEEKYNIAIRQGYGLTEASPIVTWNMKNLENRIGSIGKPVGYNELKVVDEGGEVLGAGQEGELLVKGTNVISHYFNRPDKTALYIQDGWLHTGDIGKYDDDGYYYITGRKKDMIIKNGLNIYPKEVERILRYHPDIENVTVTPYRTPDEETLSAEVTMAKGKEMNLLEMKKWCKENISSYKIPDTFTFN
jgi:long-chain acyl-CoA synthetase